MPCARRQRLLNLNARLGRQWLVAAAAVTNLVTGVTGTGTVAAAVSSPTLAQSCPTFTTNLNYLGVRRNTPAPAPTASTTSVLSSLVSQPSGPAPEPAPLCGPSKPCIFPSTRPSLLPTQAQDYYTTTTSSITPRRRGAQVTAPVCESPYTAKYSSHPPRYSQLLQVRSLPTQQPGSLRFFSTSPSAMTAAKLDGTAIAKSIRERLAAEIVEKQKLNPHYQPSLKIIQGLFTANH